jgi:nitroreductase/NAD-dependent dihydropyrimidine dehydrogenase PreA subunit
MALIRVDPEKCRREGRCVEVCPLAILGMDPERGPQVRANRGHLCIACGHCVAVCPHGALDNVRNPLATHEALPDYPVLGSRQAFTFLRSRRSIRCYREEPVPRDVLLELLEVARYAPSGHNSQGLSYLIVEGRESLQGIRDTVVAWMRETIRSNPELARQLHMQGIVRAHRTGEDLLLRGAPHLVLATGRRDFRPVQASTFLALEYVELYATSLGLGTCWAGYVQACAQNYPPLSAFLRIPEGRVISGAMMVGYPRYVYHRLPGRNPLEVAWSGADGSSGE